MKQHMCTFGLVALGSIGTMGLYKYTKDFYRNNYKQDSNLKNPTTRELMAIGGITSIVGLTLSLVNNYSLFKMIQKKED